MIDAGFYTESVLPLVNSDLVRGLMGKYPQLRLQPEVGSRSFADLPILMLVALTGTGKTTTLELMAQLREAGEINYSGDLPTRREVADLVIIPTAQVVLGESVQPVQDRVERFRLTRAFAQQVSSGGVGTAYHWLHTMESSGLPFVSDGLRGAGEIAYSLAHCEAWHVIELGVSPLARLRRLSRRNDAFDHADESDDLSFLPVELQTSVREAVSKGKVSPRALTIMRAEAQNYDFTPFDEHNQTSRYRYMMCESLRPHKVVEQVVSYMKEAFAGVS